MEKYILFGWFLTLFLIFYFTSFIEKRLYSKKRRLYEDELVDKMFSLIDDNYLCLEKVRILSEKTLEKLENIEKNIASVLSKDEKWVSCPKYLPNDNETVQILVEYEKEPLVATYKEKNKVFIPSDLIGVKECIAQNTVLHWKRIISKGNRS